MNTSASLADGNKVDPTTAVDSMPPRLRKKPSLEFSEVSPASATPPIAASPGTSAKEVAASAAGLAGGDVAVLAADALPVDERHPGAGIRNACVGESGKMKAHGEVVCSPDFQQAGRLLYLRLELRGSRKQSWFHESSQFKLEFHGTLIEMNDMIVDTSSGTGGNLAGAVTVSHGSG